MLHLGTLPGIAGRWLKLDTGHCMCAGAVSAPAPPDTLALGSQGWPEPPPARTWVLLQPPQLCSPRLCSGVPKSGSRAGAITVAGHGASLATKGRVAAEKANVMFSAYLRVGRPQLNKRSSSMDIPKHTGETLTSWWSESDARVSSLCQDDSPQ